MTDGPGLDERCAYVGPWTFALEMACEMADREAADTVPDKPPNLDEVSWGWAWPLRTARRK